MSMSSIRARLEVIEALLRGELSHEEARSRIAAIKRRTGLARKDAIEALRPPKAAPYPHDD